MILAITFVAGAALGLVYFAGLWWAVRAFAAGRIGMGRLAGSSVARFFLAGAAFYGFALQGAAAALAALAGFCLARWSLTHVLGSAADAK